MGSSVRVIITTLAQFVSLLIIVDSVLSFMLPPMHPIRDALGRILNPLYAPIRKILPATGGIDFSPLVLLVIVQVIEMFLVQVLA